MMINHVIHPRVDLTADATLTRRVRLFFSGGTVSGEELTGFGAGLPVAVIDGIAQKYANDLALEGIFTIGDLGNVDPLIPLGGIPPVRLREFGPRPDW